MSKSQGQNICWMTHLIMFVLLIFSECILPKNKIVKSGNPDIETCKDRECDNI